MTDRIYYLSTCNTCTRILNGINDLDRFELIDIKESNIKPEVLDWIAGKVGNYEAIFSKRARKYRGIGLHEQSLKESDFRRLMLDEYTFLKRPFIIYHNEVFIGNAPKEVERAYSLINHK